MSERKIRFSVHDYNGVQLHQETLVELPKELLMPDSERAIATWDRLKAAYPDTYLFRETFNGEETYDAAKKGFVTFGDFFQHIRTSQVGTPRKAGNSDSAKQSRKVKEKAPPKEKVIRIKKSLEPVVYF